MQALQFPRGAIYQIVCKAADQALRVQGNDPQSFHKSRVVGTNPNVNDDGQLWMIQKVGAKDDEFQFINCISGMVFDEQWKEIKLKPGKQSSDQLFAVVKAPVQAFYSYYWIKTSAKGDRAVSLEGILRYGNFDPNSESQLFRFELVNNNNSIQNSTIIINNLSGKAIDIPDSSFKKQVTLVQWVKNKKFNQRWRIRNSGDGVTFESLLNNFAIDICGGNTKPGSKIIQWESSGSVNQKWVPQKCGNGLYKLKSCLEPSLYLAVKGQSVDDGARIEVTNNQNPSMYWKFQGQQP